MAHSYVSCLVHYIFSTKNRRKMIRSDIRERLWSYIGGIARENKIGVYKIGGTADHIHILVSLSSTMPIAKAVQLIKAGSSGWIRGQGVPFRKFEWQKGYGAFSVSISGKQKTVEYIEQQEEHHRTNTFKDEFIAFWKKHHIEYDEKYIWD